MDEVRTHIAELLSMRGRRSRLKPLATQSPSFRKGSRSLDKGWGEFVRQLEYKLGWTAGKLIKVDPAYTSQTCPACGVVDPASRITRDCFVCRSCGHADHADVVGAKEILRRGLEKLAAQGIILPGGGHPLAACGELGVTRSMKQEETANRLEILEVAV